MFLNAGGIDFNCGDFGINSRLHELHWWPAVHNGNRDV